MKIHITIEPGKFTGAVIEWVGKHRRTSAVFMLVISFVALWAAPITKPHTFSNGGIVSAGEMNANFDALYTKVNGLDSTNLRFPDRLDGTPIAITLSGNTYTVPAGKTLHLLSTGANINRGGQSICPLNPMSCIIESGAVLSSGSNTTFTGILVDTVTIPVNDNSKSYTVPVGKTLVVLSSPVGLYVNSQVTYNFTGNLAIFPSGTSITWSSDGWITGYLK